MAERLILRCLLEDTALPPKRLALSDLDSLVAANMTMVMRVAVRLTGDLHIAEDAVQDALLKVVKHFGSFRGECTFETWLVRIVVNSVRDQLRKQVRADGIEPYRDAVDCKEPHPETRAATHELEQIIRSEVNRLPLRQREVLALCLWETQPAEQVAQVLGMTVQNVYATLHVAKQKLRERLSVEQFNHE